MKVRGQVVTAAAATVILFTAASGILLSGGSRTSFAEPLTKEGLTALEAAVTNPSSALAAVLQQMDALQSGSAAQFVNALKTNTDTDALATALQNLVAANGALAVTFASALSTLAATPNLPSIATTAGNYVNLPNLLSSDSNHPILTATRPTSTNLASNDGQIGGKTGGDQSLENLNPAAPRFNPQSSHQDNVFKGAGRHIGEDQGRGGDHGPPTIIHSNDDGGHRDDSRSSSNDGRGGGDFHPPSNGGRGNSRS